MTRFAEPKVRLRAAAFMAMAALVCCSCQSGPKPVEVERAKQTFLAAHRSRFKTFVDFVDLSASERSALGVKSVEELGAKYKAELEAVIAQDPILKVAGRCVEAHARRTNPDVSDPKVNWLGLPTLKTMLEALDDLKHPDEPLTEVGCKWPR